MSGEDRVECRTPTEGKGGTTRIPRWKYDIVRAAIIDSVQAAGDAGLPFKILPDEVRKRLAKPELDRLGSVGWHVTTVKLEMEVAGELQRICDATPQRLRLG